MLIANIVAYRKSQLGACGVSLSTVMGGLVCAGPAIVVTGIITALAGLISWAMGGKPRCFLICSVGSMLASHLVVGLLIDQTFNVERELRELYPTQSLAGRLAYESRTREVEAICESSDREPLNAAANSHLDELESQVKLDTLRNLALERLHQSVVEDFIDSPGFGVVRRIRPRKEYIDLPEAAPISFPPPPYDPQTVAADLEPIVQSKTDGSNGSNLPPQADLWELHRDCVLDFANAKGFGYIKDREHVRGFQAHQFHSMPSLPEASQQRWLIQKIELASLLTHDEPVVYISDHLPRMEELRRAATRPLTSFEKQALKGQRCGSDLEIVFSGTRIQMMGSIRAVTQCLDCHDVKRGELLGAFSYYLKRETAPSQDRK